MQMTSDVESRENRGICPSCENLPLCNYTHPSRQPVFFCEEFSTGNTSVLPIAVQDRPVGAAERRPSGEERKGLCANCDNVQACRYPKDEAGVWHCEEYR